MKEPIIVNFKNYILDTINIKSRDQRVSGGSQKSSLINPKLIFTQVE